MEAAISQGSGTLPPARCQCIFSEEKRCYSSGVLETHLLPAVSRGRCKSQCGTSPDVRGRAAGREAEGVGGRGACAQESGEKV